jgi:Zn-finger nucleic acid-binding protein
VVKACLASAVVFVRGERKGKLSNTCPRCRQPLVQNQVDEFTVRLCVPCKGIFLTRTDLGVILDRSWRAVTREAAEKLEFHATDALKKEPVFQCPECGAPMDKYGYMGMAAIPIDRCDHCDEVWLDANELETMVLALAKDNYRSGRELSRERAQQLSLGAGATPSQPNRMNAEGLDTGLAVAQVLLSLLK